VCGLRWCKVARQLLASFEGPNPFPLVLFFPAFGSDAYQADLSLL
jgi:hypothetical protein